MPRPRRSGPPVTDGRAAAQGFSVIKIGLESVDPLILAGIRFTLCALPAVFLLKRPQVPWRYIIGYGLVFGLGLWGVENLGIKAGVSPGIASLVLQFSAFLTTLLGAVVFRESLSRFQYLGIPVALASLFSIMFVTDGTVTLVGVALVLFGAVSWSVADVIPKKAASKEVLGFLMCSCRRAPEHLPGIRRVELTAVRIPDADRRVALPARSGLRCPGLGADLQRVAAAAQTGGWSADCRGRRAAEPVVATAGAFDLKWFHQQALDLGSMGLDLLRTELTSKPGPAVLPGKS